MPDDQAPSAGWLSTPKSWASASWNIVKAIGPFALSQSDACSARWADHQKRLADVRIFEAQETAKIEVQKDVTKHALTQQIDILFASHRELIETLPGASATERVSVQRDIEYIENELRRLQTASIAVGYLSDARTEESKPQEGEPAEINDLWIDRFNDLAKLRTEDWRRELLARALAAEASAPGSVALQTLWMIGMLEEYTFRAFAALLDHCVLVSGMPCIPDPTLIPKSIHHAQLPEGEAGFGNLLNDLLTAGLFSDPVAMTLTFATEKYRTLTFAYGATSQEFLLAKDLEFPRPMRPTLEGIQLAQFHDFTPNEHGRHAYDLLMQNIAEAGSAEPVNTM